MSHKRLTWYFFSACVFSAFAVPCGAQVTVQYDTGDTSSPRVIINSREGNEFTNLGAAKTITKVSWFQSANPGVVNLRFKESRSNAGEITFYQQVGGANGFISLTGLSVNFTGTDVWVGFNNYNSHAIGFDAADGGFGLHGFIAPGGTALGGNFVLRISGPSGLPVELMTFEIE